MTTEASAYGWANTLVGVHHSMFRALIVNVYVNETQYICIDFDGHHFGGSSFDMYMIF